MYEDTKGELAPWTNAGKDALSKYQTMLDAGPGHFVKKEGGGSSGGGFGGVGGAASKALRNLLNKDQYDYVTDEFVPEEQPGYKFGFNEFIEDPYLSGQGAKGKRLSGETVKGLTKYASDYAETSYDNFLNRYYKKMGQFSNMSNVGQAAASKSAVLSQTTGENIGQSYLNMGNIQAQNAMNQGNIATQSGAAYAGIAQGAGQNYLNYKMMEKMGVG